MRHGRGFVPDQTALLRRVPRLNSCTTASRATVARVPSNPLGVRISPEGFGSDHPSVANLVNNLGLVLRNLGDLDGARKAYQRALAIDEKSFGPDHPSVAIDVNNLGMVLQDLGDLDGARKAYQRALAIDEKAFGPDHPKVAIRVNNLGGVLRSLGDLDGAGKAFQRPRGGSPRGGLHGVRGFAPASRARSPSLAIAGAPVACGHDSAVSSRPEAWRPFAPQQPPLAPVIRLMGATSSCAARLAQDRV